jgi:hypothetical protein
MVEIITSFIPFPNIYWWAIAAQADVVCFDKAEHFQKMTYRNRYYISGSGGLLQLSVPLAGGRNKRVSMAEAEISDRDNWQLQHWRTIVSVYRRAPYFEFYEMELQQLFEISFRHLMDFNLATIHWLKKQLKIQFEEAFTAQYVKEYQTESTDLRTMLPGIEKATNFNFPLYCQLFQERVGFLPNLSMLDLLFSEGPYAMQWINANREQILAGVAS